MTRPVFWFAAVPALSFFAVCCLWLADVLIDGSDWGLIGAMFPAYPWLALLPVPPTPRPPLVVAIVVSYAANALVLFAILAGAVLLAKKAAKARWG